MTFEETFSPDFRQHDIKQLLAYVTAGKLCQLISLPGGGKATLLKLLARNKNIRAYHLGAKEKSHHFVYLNLLELDNFEQASVDEFLLHSLKPDAKHSADPFILSKQLMETVSKLTARVTLVLLFDHFDEFQNRLTRSFFQRLRTIRGNNRYKFTCVFATRRDLRQLVDPEIRREFYDFFVGNTVYMKLYDEKATTILFSQIEEAFGKKLSKQQRADIINLTSGHAKITRVCAEALLQENTSLQTDTLLTKPVIRASLFELWLFLTAQEQHILTSLAKNVPVQKDDSVDNLVNFGLLKPFNQQSNNSTIQPASPAPASTSRRRGEKRGEQFNNFVFTIPLFEQFVRTNADTLHREKISYRQNTHEVTKGEEVISDLLSPQENRLLKYLIENEQRIIEREEIISAVWPQALQAEGISDEAIDQMVFRIRKKIEDEPNNPKHILTVKGSGFRFQP